MSEKISLDSSDTINVLYVPTLFPPFLYLILFYFLCIINILLIFSDL